MNSDTFHSYHDAIMLIEEARILARKMELQDDESYDERTNDVESIRLTRELYLRALSIQENLSGWCNDDTGRIYYELGWFLYDNDEYDHALTYLLQALRSSHQLYDDMNEDEKHHPATKIILDDIQDLLEDMDMDEEHANQVFESWELQSQAEDILVGRNQVDARDDAPNSSLDCRCPSPALLLYQQALDKLPTLIGFGLERAYIFRRMAAIATAQHEWEDAVGYYYSALIRLPNWLYEDHPTIRTIKKETEILVRHRLTTICNGRQHAVMLVPAVSREEEFREDSSSVGHLLRLSLASTMYIPSHWSKSYAIPKIKKANE